MKYQNAKEFLDQETFERLQEKAGGRLLYVPTAGEKRNWGELSGERTKLQQRNQLICREYQAGAKVRDLADRWFLSVASIRKIVAAKNMPMPIHYLGLDIGGTFIKYGVTDEDGNLLVMDKVPAPKTSELFLAALHRIIDTARENDKQIGGIGVGCAGVVENRNVVTAINLPLKEFPLRDHLAAYSGLPVELENDANCAALGEYTVAKDGKNLLYITLGTGVGGGLILNGQLYRGSHGGAGEVGHITLKTDGEPCYCGKRGCFERYASTSALVRQTEQAIAAHADAHLAALAKENPVDGILIFRAADEGCAVAKQVINTYCRHLAAGIDSLCAVLDPERVELAGAITKQGNNLLTPLRAHLHTKAHLSVAENTGASGVIGAARLFAQAGGRKD